MKTTIHDTKRVEICFITLQHILLSKIISILIMNKNRLETFSDGVFAIVITLLVLNISLPDTDINHLANGLLLLLPKLFSYLISFVLIGLYWVGHHFYFDKIKKINGTFLWLNLLLLLSISILPFPTSLLGKFPFQPLTLTIYGCNLLATNLISFLMLRYIYCNRQLANEHFKDEFYKTQLPVFISVNAIYVVAIACSFFYPVISYVLFISVLVITLKMYIKRMNEFSK
ncbi:MAG: hypothetical protein RI955_695 [Bacteroidota bacterium]|jgi:uncharacterized membrane protein